MRHKGAVLIGRKDNEYWFVDSVFDHGTMAGCTGSVVRPVSESELEDMLSIDNLIDRFDYVWAEQNKEQIDPDCDNCRFGVDEDGCKYCGYESLRAFCEQVARFDGQDAVIDFPGHDFQEVLEEIVDNVETVDHTSGGRIFRDIVPSDFDEIYNHKALVACLAYEDGAVDYDYAVRVIFG